MSTPILATKLYIPPPRPQLVDRPRLIERLNINLNRRLTLISAPAGFGKTTLISEWVTHGGRPTAWLSLDEGDNDPTRFVAYLVAALQTIAAGLGTGVLGALQAPQPPALEAILTNLLNEISAIPHPFLLVLDDYHIIESPAVDKALTFLLDHLPPPLHLVIATREDPPLPLARLRGRGQLTELRAADLRFTPPEAASFLNHVMGLNLTSAAVAALETRTEGWIAGLQLAAISMQGQPDPTAFIESFTGSHHFVLDYLVEEVLQRQPASVQAFLLHTAILGRLCGPLCDAVLGDPTLSGQEMLHYMEQANLFLIPLDNERRWYRYHHLFADLLQQRLHQNSAHMEANGTSVADLHGRASLWYEANGLEIEAFHHATAAHDTPRAIHLMEGNGMPLHFRGAMRPVLNWLATLPPTAFHNTPSLSITYASSLLMVGQIASVEPHLQAAEAALHPNAATAESRDLIGHIAAIRATLAVAKYQAEEIIAQSERALAHLHPANVPVRTSIKWTLGYAYQLQGDRTAARQAYEEAIAISERIGHVIIQILATIGLGNIQEADTQLHLAAETYQRVLEWAGNPPLPVASEAHLGLARLAYEWNDLAAAQEHAQQSMALAQQFENGVDSVIHTGIFLARVRLAQRDVAGTAVILAQTEQLLHQHQFTTRTAEVAAVRVDMLLQQGQFTAAADLAHQHELPMGQARAQLALGQTAAALDALTPLYHQAKAKGWAKERLQLLALQAAIYYEQGEKSTAVALLGEALPLAQAGGFIRTFVDTGAAMVPLLAQSTAATAYVAQLLAACEAEAHYPTTQLTPPTTLAEPLSEREHEVLQLIAQGLSNRDISERLFLALSTVKGHNQLIFGKLQVQRRTEAVARARELGLLA